MVAALVSMSSMAASKDRKNPMDTSIYGFICNLDDHGPERKLGCM
jgi:hypothetical protein